MSQEQEIKKKKKAEEEDTPIEAKPANPPESSKMGCSVRYDHIALRNITTTLNIQPDPWHRENVPQPALISVKIAYPSQLVQESANHDSVKYSLDYGKLYREISGRLARRSKTEPAHVHELAWDVVDVCFLQLSTTVKHQVASDLWTDIKNDATVDVSVHLPKGILRADGGVTYNVVRTASASTFMQKWTIHDMRCYCILGINPHERLEKQRVNISMEFKKEEETLQDLQRMTAALAQTVENSSYQTVEALATHLCDEAIHELKIPEITLSVEKPSAISMAGCSIVEITRNWADFA
ncbi:serine/threonine-protein kinase psk1 [Ascosphaera apis ARSEF 7405]|uniref:dihydroneopterin aldolase n=1 Tax=Ascosphaera apis ARSEF 7405 TaxID=392613 RepID=A0A162IBL2_9EURO|nr:serine/threonine-protein kinase psk1 [Ascosphaera apis ARSEF 7405]